MTAGVVNSKTNNLDKVISTKNPNDITKSSTKPRNLEQKEQINPEEELAKPLSILLNSFIKQGKTSILIEAALATYSTITTKRSDYMIHTGARIVEIVRDYLIEKNKLPASLQNLLIKCSNFFGAKNEQGEKISSENIEENKAKITGALNLLISLPSFVLALAKPYISYKIHGNNHQEKLNWQKKLVMILNGLTAPVNVFFMWPIGQAQRLWATTLSKLSSKQNNKELIQEAMTSGADHWIRGFQALSISLSMPFGKIFPKINYLLEALTGGSIAALGIYNGISTIKNKNNVEPQLKKIEQKIFGKLVYKFLKIFDWITKIASKGKANFPIIKFENLLDIIKNKNSNNIQEALAIFKNS